MRKSIVMECKRKAEKRIEGKDSREEQSTDLQFYHRRLCPRTSARQSILSVLLT